MEKQKVIVTGGAGFIGSNLVEELVLRGYEVHVVDNLVAGKKENVHKDATIHIVDVRNLEDLKKVFSGARYVFHLAALPRVQFSIENPVETNEINVLGTQNVLVAAKECGVKRVVYSASAAVYGDQSEMPLKEDMIPNPKSPYALHKYVGEIYCRLWSEIYSLETVSLRYFNVYGPRQSSGGAYALVIAKFLQHKKEGRKLPITGDGEQTRDYVHVFDVARANILAALNEELGKGEVVNIGTGQNISVNKVAELIGGQTEYISPRLEPRNAQADNSKARKFLGWEPTITLERGIMKLLEDNT